jgi:DegV family protein with EDD domain
VKFVIKEGGTLSKIKIVVDSACDLTQEVLDAYGITSLPLRVEIDGQSYRDRVDISPQAFYTKLLQTTSMPKTSQVAPNEFFDVFKSELERDPDLEILYIAFSSPLSGTHSSSCCAKDLLGGDPRITIIDSAGASLGLGLIAIEAAEMARDGKPLSQILERVRELIATMRYVFIVGNFELLKRGGRISATTAMVGNLFNIKLILHFVDGLIVPLTKVHGVKKAYNKLLDIMNEDAPHPGQCIGISYAYDREMALRVEQMIADKFKQRTMLTEIGAVIGAHVGANTIAVFYTADRH